MDTLDQTVVEDRIVELWANDRFGLDDPDAVWVLREGTLDLFAQERPEGALASALMPLFRVGAGAAVFGLPHHRSRLSVVASPSAGAKVLCTSLPQLRARLASDPGDLTVVRWLDGWIEALGRAAAGDALPPADLVALKADQSFTLEDGPRAVAPRDGVLWVNVVDGDARVLGLRDARVASGMFVPASLHGWLDVESGTLRAVSTQRWHTFDPGWTSLRTFHELALAALARRRAVAGEHEEERLRAKAHAASSTLHTGMQRLAKSLGRTCRSTAEEEADGDPLLAACRAVGAATGVRLVRPPGWSRGTVVKEPVEAIARASSVRVRKVVLRDDWWRRATVPLLAFREADGHPVALLPRARGRYTLADPTSHSSAAVDRGVAAVLSSIAYTFYRPFPEKPVGFVDLLSFGLADCRRDLVVILAMGFAGGLLNLAAPLAMGIVFDAAIPGAQRGQVVTLAGFVAIAGLSVALFTLTRNFATLRLQGRVDAALQSAAWDRLLRLPVPFFRQYSSGDLAVRSLAFTEIRQVLAGPALSLIITQLFSVLSAALLFFYSTRLAAIACLLMAVAFIVSTTALVVYVRYSRHVATIRGRLSGLTMELVQGVAKFRMAGAEGRALARWALVTGQRKQLQMKAAHVERGLAVFEAAWPLFSVATVFYAASALIGEGGMSTGSLLAFLTIFTQLVTTSLQFAHQMLPVLALIPVYERMKPMLAALPEADTAKAPPGELTGAIEVNHLLFRYAPDAPLVLRDITCRVLPGEMVAIVGPSGCGKSTLLRLLLGFERPQSGAIYYDRQDLAGLDVQAVRRQIGVVLQGGKLGTGTLLNLIVGSTGRTVQDAWEAARMTGLEKDIKAMPMGIHTVVSDDGGTLSGGQRQRLMIARAIVNRPRVLFFDEATSALDNETQAIVTKSLESLHATRVVIAHRLSTILNADRILMLDKGVVVQAGTYEELMAQDGPFRQLASRQVA